MARPFGFMVELATEIPEVEMVCTISATIYIILLNSFAFGQSATTYALCSTATEQLAQTPSPSPRTPPDQSMPTAPSSLELTPGTFEFVGRDAGEAKELVPGIVFHWCPAGKFMMGSPASESKRGSEEDQVEVTLSQGYWLGETEVTQRQWRELMGTTPWKGKPSVEEDDNFPASYVSHNDAMKFVEKLTQQEHAAGRLPAGWVYSLPTEAQWEYACRAGSKTKYSFGDSELELPDYAWFRRNAGVTPEDAGRKKANAWGLKDMHGNLWEWCQDWAEWAPQGGADPVGSPTGTFRVRRGGSWFAVPESCRSAMRHFGPPDLRHMEIGFRLAAVPGK